MENKRRMTANYKIVMDAGGNRYQFFCELSGAHVHTTKPIRADTPEQALEIAWETEGKEQFNYCKKCGKWVSSIMYNADVCECVKCAPWENYPLYCPQCGKKIFDTKRFCPHCGTLLRYEGGE